MTWSIDIAPMVPTALLVAATVVALALVAVLFFRRTRGAALRALALAAIVAALANPSFRQEERESLANIAVVLVDESTSQTIAGRPAQTAAIRADLEEKLQRIPGLEVKWINASRPTGEGTSGTHLFAELNRALSEIAPDRLAGVIMITDGQVHDIPASAAALGFNAPVHALITGRPEEFDRRIEVITAPKFGIVNGPPRDIEIAVREAGKRGQASGQVTLRVRREGQPDETVRTEIDHRARIPMSFPTAGQNIVEIELEPVPGELTHLNNRVVIAAEGVRENLRVLLVSGEPHAGERVWRNLLKSDAAVDLVHFTILRPPEKQDGTPIHQLSLIAFPTRELFSEKISNFDLIIFDRYQNRGILPPVYYDNIARYVANHGGALLVASGDDFAQSTSLYRTALAPVLPASPSGRVIEEPFKARVTVEGHKHPVTRSLPGLREAGSEPDWGRWFRQVETNVIRGRTLMSGVQEKPLLVLDRVGRGRVALLLSDHAWLWSRGYDGGGPHTDLLRRTAHWLMKEPDLEEERLIASSRGLKLTIERRTMETEVPPVSVQSPGGETSQVTLEAASTGVWRTTIDVRQPGLYKMQTNGPAPDRRVLTAVAHAGLEDAREMNEVTATDAKLKPLIAATGGGAFWTRAASGLLSSDTAVEVPRVSLLANARVLAGSGWLGLKDREAYVTRGVRITPMFTGLLALAALLAFLTLAWWREGR
jgi:uncharacterized membrane protein